MKKWYVGVDGGGTKTAIMAATKTDGETGAELTAGCSYQMLGVDGATKMIADGVKSSLQKVGAQITDCAGVCIGLPCYGEDARQDEAMRDSLRKALAPAPLHIVNDVEVGWAGALECQPGIHIVAGTGSIAFAKDESGHAARSGGWNEFFGDEGSCYWIGKEAMSLPKKQMEERQKALCMKSCGRSFGLPMIWTLLISLYGNMRRTATKLPHFSVLRRRLLRKATQKRLLCTSAQHMSLR